MRITLHLSGWKQSGHLSDQSCNCEMSFCRHSVLPEEEEEEECLFWAAVFGPQTYKAYNGISDLTYTFVSSANSLTPH